MRRPAADAGRGMLGVLAASVLWGTTGTAATCAPAVGPLAIGAAAMGLGGLLQALTAAGPITRHRAALHAQRRAASCCSAGRRWRFTPWRSMPPCA